MRRLKDPIKHHPVYDKTIRHARILDIVEQLIGLGEGLMVRRRDVRDTSATGPQCSLNF